MKLAILLISLLLVSIMSHSNVTAQTNSAYQYAYLLRDMDDAIGIMLIDPATGEQRELPLQITMETDERVGYGEASPMGEWVYFLVSSGQYVQHLRIINLVTGEIRNVYTYGNFRRFLWSPDGQYLALIATDHDLALLGVPREAYVYSVVENRLQIVGSNYDDDDYDFSWSPDSQRLLVFSNEYCGIERTNCPQTALMEIIEIRNLNTILATEFRNFRDRLCNFEWSPDNRYVSFQFSCGDLLVGVSGSAYISDVFLWDTVENTIVAVTTFTQPLSSLDSVDLTLTYFSGYDTEWLTPNELMIAVFSGRWNDRTGYDPVTVQTGTYIYAVDGDLSLYSSRSILYGPGNPVFSEYAILSSQPQVSLDSDNRNRITAADERVEIASWDGNTLHIIETLPAGCYLDWSPDGQYLVSTVDNWSPLRCEREVYSFRFYDRETSRVIMTENSRLFHDVDVLGWVQTPP
jgi:hypothetical protein